LLFDILFIFPLTWHQPWDGAPRKMKEAPIEVQRYEVDSVEASLYERFWAAKTKLQHTCHVGIRVMSCNNYRAAREGEKKNKEVLFALKS
jgi:hypothetical protein